MTVLRYRPAISGGWLVVTSGSRALIVGPSGWPMVDDAAEVIGGDRGFETTVDIITRAGFASIPDFVLLEWADGRVRSLLRGPVTLAVTDDVGEHTQDGSGISTWTERSFTGATAAHGTIEGAVDARGVEELALRSGTALLGSFVLDFRAGQVAAPEEASSPTAAASSVPSVPPLPEATVSSVAEETSVPTAETVIPNATPAAGVESVSDETIVRAPADPPASVDAIAAPPPAASDDRAGDHDGDDRAGDHDGNTILSSDIAKLRSGRRPKAATVDAPPAKKPPSIFLSLPDGSRQQLDQPALIGRSPSVSQVSGDRMPRLITVGGGDQDISRNHAQFAVEGGTVVVTDLHSRNGTVVVLPGKSPQKLRAGEPTSVLVGTVVDLGGGITLTVGEE